MQPTLFSNSFFFVFNRSGSKTRVFVSLFFSVSVQSQIKSPLVGWPGLVCSATALGGWMDEWIVREGELRIQYWWMRCLLSSSVCLSVYESGPG